MPLQTRIQRQQKQWVEHILSPIPMQVIGGPTRSLKGYKPAEEWRQTAWVVLYRWAVLLLLLFCLRLPSTTVGQPFHCHRFSARRVTSLYDLMDAACCSFELQEYSRQLGHVPLIDHNPRSGKKEPFEPYDAERYKIRSIVERTNARLKDELGGRNVWVQGAQMVYSHLMFGLLVLSADQLMRILQ